MSLRKQEKQPVDVKDYPIDFRPWLVDGDTLVDATADIACLSSEDNSLLVKHLILAPHAVSVWLEGGLDGERYQVNVTVTTAGGRVDQSEFIMTVRER